MKMKGINTTRVAASTKLLVMVVTKLRVRTARMNSNDDDDSSDEDDNNVGQTDSEKNK